MVIALRSHTLKHTRDDWSYYTVTSGPVVGYGTNMFTDKSRIKTSNLTVTSLLFTLHYQGLTFLVSTIIVN